MEYVSNLLRQAYEAGDVTVPILIGVLPLIAVITILVIVAYLAATNRMSRDRWAIGFGLVAVASFIAVMINVVPMSASQDYVNKQWRDWYVSGMGTPDPYCPITSGKLVQKVDENGDPVFDENGKPILVEEKVSYILKSRPEFVGSTTIQFTVMSAEFFGPDLHLCVIRHDPDNTQSENSRWAERAQKFWDQNEKKRGEQGEQGQQGQQGERGQQGQGGQGGQSGQSGQTPPPDIEMTLPGEGQDPWADEGQGQSEGEGDGQAQGEGDGEGDSENEGEGEGQAWDSPGGQSPSSGSIRIRPPESHLPSKK